MQVESAETVVTCYLCLRRVPLAAWRQGHRQECAFSHQQTLYTMKSPENNKIRQASSGHLLFHSDGLVGQILPTAREHVLSPVCKYLMGNIF